MWLSVFSVEVEEKERAIAVCSAETHFFFDSEVSEDCIYLICEIDTSMSIR